MIFLYVILNLLMNNKSYKISMQSGYVIKNSSRKKHCEIDFTDKPVNIYFEY